MKPFRKWNAPLNGPAVVAMLLIPCVFMALWMAILSPQLSGLIRPLEQTSPFAHDLLRGLVAFSLLPCTLVPLVVALYLYQRRWDKIHSQSGRRED